MCVCGGGGGGGGGPCLVKIAVLSVFSSFALTILRKRKLDALL